MFDPELDALKYVDLRQYAASQGFALDKRKSWRGSAVMRHANGDKIIIKRDAGDGHYVWCSVHSQARGTILDFVHYLKGGAKGSRMDIGSIREELRPWIGLPPIPVPSFPPLDATPKDRMKVEADFERMQDAPRHPYLENERALPCPLLQSERFLGQIRIDGYGNAVFPHMDVDGICGFEKKNTGYTSFSAGGAKALWLSRAFPEDDRLAFFESAIDALSYAALHPAEHTRYASLSGKPSPSQLELIRAAIARMPAGSEIVAAMDADEDGRKLAEVVRRAFELSGRGDLRFTVEEPEGAKDWNDLLRARPLTLLPHLHAKESVPQ